MDIAIVIVVVLVVVAATALATAEFTRRRFEPVVAPPDLAETPDAPDAPPVDELIRVALGDALVEMREQTTAERDAAVTAALQQAAVLQREQLGSVAQQARQQTAAELNAKKDVIDTRLDQVHTEMRNELNELGAMVNKLAETSAEKFGQVASSLSSHAEVTSTLSESARALREAMASPTARGQWGERMAEDVLRLAGFVENVNYVKQTKLEGASGRPDFTFPLPKGHELYMDVKFPMTNYLSFLDATTDTERDRQRTAFVRAVKGHVKELARRDYANESARPSVDYVLMFLPNEQLTGFIHETDPSLIDEAMRQRVLICSPLTLFAFLGVIRQAYDNFVIEQTSDQILALMGRFSTEWTKYTDELGKLKRRFDQLGSQFDTMVGTRKRQLEKPLQQLESVRRERNIPIDGELFPELDSGDLDAVEPGADATPANVRRLGA